MKLFAINTIRNAILILIFLFSFSGMNHNALEIWLGHVHLFNKKIVEIEVQFLQNNDLLWIERIYKNWAAFKEGTHLTETVKTGRYEGIKKRFHGNDCISLLPFGMIIDDQKFVNEPKGPSCITYRQKGFAQTMYILPYKLNDLSNEEQMMICQRYKKES
jgi:hypothetical protein